MDRAHKMAVGGGSQVILPVFHQLILKTLAAEIRKHGQGIHISHLLQLFLLQMYIMPQIVIPPARVVDDEKCPDPALVGSFKHNSLMPVRYVFQDIVLCISTIPALVIQ